MSYFKQPLLLMFLGLPGSGKSYFARAAADKMNAVRLNGDSMRLSMFGSREELERIYQTTSRNVLNDYVFNAIDYTVDQVLLRGHDVVYDAHHNKRIDRKKNEQLARKHGAIPLLVWIKTPDEVALKRGQTREETIDQRRLSEEKMRESMARHQAVTDEPEAGEIVITIDGEIPFEEQFKSFEQQLAEIENATKNKVKQG